MGSVSFFWLFLVILVSLIIFSLSILFSLKKRNKDDEKYILTKKKIRESFRKGISNFEKILTSKKNKYSHPWVILLNEGSEKNRIPIDQKKDM